MTTFDAFYRALASIGYTEPVHPPFAHMPTGLVVGALTFYILALLYRHANLALSTRYCFILAWVFLFPTMLAGFMDWQHFYHGAWIFPIVAKICLSGLLLVLLTVAIVPAYKGTTKSRGILSLYVLSFLTVGGLGYFGGKIAYAGQTETTPEDLQAGSKVFVSNCRGCHENGGNMVMPDMPLKGADDLKSPAALISRIRNPRLPDGSKGPMPEFSPKKISDAEAKQLYEYLIHEFGKPGEPPPKK